MNQKYIYWSLYIFGCVLCNTHFILSISIVLEYSTVVPLLKVLVPDPKFRK